MNARKRLFDALLDETENADFTTEQGIDDSYQNMLNRITEIFRQYPDDSLTLQDIVEVVNYMDDLSIPLVQAYRYACISLLLEYE